MAACSAWHGLACPCFAADLGRSCSYCAVSNECLEATGVNDACLQSASARREDAGTCGSASEDTNLADEPDSLVADPPGIPWSGEEVSIELGTVFPVDYVSVELVQNPTETSVPGVRLGVWPSTSENAAAVSKACTEAGACVWELPMPVLKNLTLTSAQPGQEMHLQRLVVHLGTFAPVDGGLGYTDAWSECSTGCGNGTQQRPSHCSSPEPAYGGLPCYAPDMETVVVAGNISRTCYESWDCGTDWRVVLIVGWWQLLLVVVFVSRKLFQWVRERRQTKIDAAKLRRRRFSSDFDDIGERIRVSGRVENADDDDNDGNANGDVEEESAFGGADGSAGGSTRNYRQQRDLEGEQATEHLTLA